METEHQTNARIFGERMRRSNFVIRHFSTGLIWFLQVCFETYYGRQNLSRYVRCTIPYLRNGSPQRIKIALLETKTIVFSEGLMGLSMKVNLSGWRRYLRPFEMGPLIVLLLDNEDLFVERDVEASSLVITADSPLLYKIKSDIRLACSQKEQDEIIHSVGTLNPEYARALAKNSIVLGLEEKEIGPFGPPVDPWYGGYTEEPLESEIAKGLNFILVRNSYAELYWQVHRKFV